MDAKTSGSPLSDPAKEPAALRNPKESAERWGMNAASEKHMATRWSSNEEPGRGAGGSGAMA